MAEAAYVATPTAHIYRNRNINVPLPGPGAIPARRPLYNIASNVTDINQRNGDGDACYQSLQAKLDKRFSHGLQVLVSYTLSKSIDTVSSPIYPYYDKLNRGLSAGFKAVDNLHNLVIRYSYQLPFGPGRHYLSGVSPLARRLVEGWGVNGITTLRSGDRLVINVASSRLNTGTGNRADTTCTKVDRPNLVSRWFDTGCFADPGPLPLRQLRHRPRPRPRPHQLGLLRLQEHGH